MKIEIPMLPPRDLGPNASRKLHWGARFKLRRLWQSAVYYAGLEHRDAGYTRASLSITCVVPDRRSIMDTDNVLSICKPAIDMLTARVRGANPGRGDPGQAGLGIIRDDSPACLAIRTPITWVVDKGRAPLTIFEITEEKA